MIRQVESFSFRVVAAMINSTAALAAIQSFRAPFNLLAACGLAAVGTFVNWASAPKPAPARVKESLMPDTFQLTAKVGAIDIYTFSAPAPTELGEIADGIAKITNAPVEFDFEATLEGADLEVDVKVGTVTIHEFEIPAPAALAAIAKGAQAITGNPVTFELDAEVVPA